jgi:hypothetical protein
MMLADGAAMEEEIPLDESVPEPEELPPGDLSAPRPPKLQPTPAQPPRQLLMPRNLQPVAPKDQTKPDPKETAPGELIKPNEVPPRTAPTQLPDMGPDFIPDEDVFGPGKPKPDKTKPPQFDQPNPPPDNSIFGPAEIPSAPRADETKPKESKPEEPKADNESKSDGEAKPVEAPMSETRPSASPSVRPASAKRWPNAKPLFSRRVDHAGLLPEDHGEVRRWR